MTEPIIKWPLTDSGERLEQFDIMAMLVTITFPTHEALHRGALLRDHEWI